MHSLISWKDLSRAVVVLVATLPALRAPAGDERTYVVQPGDSVAKIAGHFGVSQTDLIDVNDLGDSPFIRPGQELVIPDALRKGSRGHTIAEGDTLVRIAKRHKVSVKELAELNNIGEGRLLTVGRTILIPGTESQSTLPASKKDKRQPVVLVQVRTGKSAKVFLTTKGGAVSQKGLRALSELAASKAVRSKKGKKARKGRVIQLHPRLVKLLGKVADNYPGRTIFVVSGYRPHKNRKDRSKHGQGRALDFRVDGVDNLELYEFIRTFPKAGTGYYPNSTFVHLDARDTSITWIDYSGPGEPARYGRPEVAENPEAASDAESASEDEQDSDLPSKQTDDAKGETADSPPL